MLCKEDQVAVRKVIEEHLLDYFDAGDVFWGDSELRLREDVCSIDVSAATQWLVGGVGTVHSLVGNG